MGKTLLIIGLGGFVGSICRYLIYHYTETISTAFPLGTYLANMTGCLLIGLILGLAHQRLSPETVFFLSVGFCGSLTTFSTFSFENLTMLQRGRFLMPLIYTSLSFTVGLLATWIGFSLARVFN